MIAQRHFQQTDWYLDLLIEGELLGTGLCGVRETRKDCVTSLGEKLTFGEAYRRFRDRALAMGREAGQEWTIKAR